MIKNLDLRAIWFDAASQRFQFGHLTESLRTIGARMAWALAHPGQLKGLDDKPLSETHGEEMMLFRGEKRSGGWNENYPVVLSLTYVQEMLRFVAQHGWFWDEVEDHQPAYIWCGERAYKCDHKFDPMHITPGVYWGEVEALRKMAAELETRAAAHDANHGKSIAEELRASAKRLRGTAERLLTKDLPSYKKERRPR